MPHIHKQVFNASSDLNSSDVYNTLNTPAVQLKTNTNTQLLYPCPFVKERYILLISFIS